MEMITRSQDNLEEIRAFILLLNDEQYTAPVDVLSGASIGKHVRHIIEFYACVFCAEPTGMVCYDERERNSKIETSRVFAMAVIENLIICLLRVKSDRPLKLKANFSMRGNDDVILETSLFRELAYNFEHAIHHEALIKVAFKELNIEGKILGHFGVSVSTIRYNNNSNNNI
ncbi:MAG: hypothetical protein WEB30_11520 [Cyclobacteriaceae bacterium]